MEESTKKPLMIGITVACLVVAGVILLMRSGGGAASGIPKGEKVWVKCEKCGAEAAYQAEKCAHCSHIFIRPRTRVSDYPDRCPECGHSNLEDERNRRLESRGEGG